MQVSGDPEQESLRFTQSVRDPGEDPRHGASARWARQWQLDLYCASGVAAVNEKFGDGHASPPCGISATAGVPGPVVAEVAQQPGKYVGGTHRIVDLFRWAGCPAVPQLGMGMLGAASDLCAVEQQRVRDVANCVHGGPRRRVSDRRPPWIIVVRSLQRGQGLSRSDDVGGCGLWLKHWPTLPEDRSSPTVNLVDRAMRASGRDWT